MYVFPMSSRSGPCTYMYPSLRSAPDTSATLYSPRCLQCALDYNEIAQIKHTQPNDQST